MHLSAGKNIAIKVPSHQFDETVVFYREIVGLEQLKEDQGSVAFEFGGKTLWLDKRDDVVRAEVWFEIHTDDIESAAAHMASSGVVRRDDVEELPAGFRGFWITNPAGIIHLVSSD